MFRKPILLALAVTAFGAGCKDSTTLLEPVPQASLLAGEDECDPRSVKELCEETTPPIFADPGWPFFKGGGGDELRSEPNDPHPEVWGIWLGANTTDETCFASTDKTITDVDKDWLDDGCEYRIARAFAPSMMFNNLSNCAEGEPYWAAKYFPRSGVVRIAYMPAYYKDCGSDNVEPAFERIGAHTGDSEFIYVEVYFNRPSGHWWFSKMWLSAHYNAGFPWFLGGGSPNRSELVSYAQTEFSKVTRSHPTIWVGRDKHANYKSAEACNQDYTTLGGALDASDSCHPNSSVRVRFPVTTSTNVGSRHVGTECVRSTDRYVDSPRTECFYYHEDIRSVYFGLPIGDGDSGYGNFRGWHPDPRGPAPPPYYDYLMSDRFEEKLGEGWGPGPEPPTLTAAIDGPGYVTEYTQGTWTAVANYGYPPYSYNWYVDRDISYIGSGSTITRWAGPQGTYIDLRLEVTDAEGGRALGGRRVYVGPQTEKEGDDDPDPIRR